MKQMPRVATFLKNFMSYHVTYPTEQEAAQAKKQPRVSSIGYFETHFDNYSSPILCSKGND